MSALTDLPELVGFFSYSREDDESYKGRLSALREAIQQELGAQLGRSKATFRLWQDKAAIAPGQLWETEINDAVSQSAFFIPIVTPRMINSRYCHFEFDAFLARERALGRSDLVFPIVYVPVAALQTEAQWRDHPVLSVIGKRQYVDWQMFRYSDVQSPAQLEAIAQFCSNIVAALRTSVVPSDQRRRRPTGEVAANGKSRPPSTAAADANAKRSSTGSHRPSTSSGEYRAASANRAPSQPSESSKPPGAAAAGRLGAAMGKIRPAAADEAARKTVFGLPARIVLPIAGAMAVIAAIVVTLVFLLPEQGPAQGHSASSAGTALPANQSAAAQPPRNTNADPPLVLNPSELYQERSTGFGNLDK